MRAVLDSSDWTSLGPYHIAIKGGEVTFPVARGAEVEIFTFCNWFSQTELFVEIINKTSKQRKKSVMDYEKQTRNKVQEIKAVK